jgi:5-methylcytosine-specific restriction endonuclease McrA
MKCCSVCAIEKSLKDFNWRNKAKGWHRPECRSCQKAAYTKARAKDPAAYNAATAERKRKWRAAHPYAGKEWYAEHREKERARCRNRSEEYRERARVRSRLWYQAHRQHHRELMKVWVERNREKIREYMRLYCARNPERSREHCRRRRARKLSRQLAYFTAKELDARMSVFGYCCAYCSGPFEEVDHAIPLARGGAHCLANLRPACRACNRRKSAKPFGAWLREVA